MELKPRGYENVLRLVEKGVDIPNPLSLDVGEEVNIEQISSKGVKIYPGCRIYGKRTVVASGAQLGEEAPVTVDDCQVGPGVELKGGYFKRSVFLEKASMGLGAHVREGCILEEQACGAHCVGLKQTILFPFVTLGSLINFCDCLMAGGTSREDHSEVGSSYIHFNFAPSGDKTTASLIGDVPRGVMLNQAPIFLGGQGGMVGPLRMGYGNVVAAGTILRHDFLEENKLITGAPHRGIVTNFSSGAYRNISRIVENNFLYMASLEALREWYVRVRKGFLEGQEFGALIFEGLLDKLTLAREERIKRLKAMAAKVRRSEEQAGATGKSGKGKREFHERIDEACRLFAGPLAGEVGSERRDLFLAPFQEHRQRHGGSYLDVVKSLPSSLSGEGTLWLDQVIKGLSMKVAAFFPSLNLFRKVTLSA